MRRLWCKQQCVGEVEGEEIFLFKYFHQKYIYFLWQAASISPLCSPPIKPGPSTSPLPSRATHSSPGTAQLQEAGQQLQLGSSHRKHSSKSLGQPTIPEEVNIVIRDVQCMGDDVIATYNLSKFEVSVGQRVKENVFGPLLFFSS